MWISLDTRDLELQPTPDCLKLPEFMLCLEHALFFMCHSIQRVVRVGESLFGNCVKINFELLLIYFF